MDTGVIAVGVARRGGNRKAVGVTMARGGGDGARVASAGRVAGEARRPWRCDGDPWLWSAAHAGNAVGRRGPVRGGGGSARGRTERPRGGGSGVVGRSGLVDDLGGALKLHRLRPAKVYGKTHLPVDRGKVWKNLRHHV